jgi:malonate-semialdehyde dehydrogenase (acetylating)/methylmalonate-semialdehyde dehydrogenase
MSTTIDCWVGGTRLRATSGRVGAVHDPATGQQTGEVGFASAADVDRAVAVAADAAAQWGRSSLAARTRVLFAMRELVAARRDDLARAITAEHGKVLDDARGEVARGLECLEYACGLADHLKGEHSWQASTEVDVTSIRLPLGVVVGITPFNFPVMVPLWMCPNAIAAGNAFILKPSEQDPSPSLLLAEMWQEAGLPDGVFNVVQGDREAVDALLTHPGVAAVSFVGSTPVARHVSQTAHAHGKRVQALGGAKNHMVVLPDADLEVAADAAVSAAFGSAGERCMAISVLVPVGDIAEPLLEAVVDRAKGLVVGPGTDPASDLGPLISRTHRDRVASYVEGAPAEGATVLLDGVAQRPAGDGFYLGVSVIDGVTPDMSCYRDEIFGPVLSVVRAATYDDAVALVNSNPYGNGVAIFTRDGRSARRFQADVEVGMVGVNVPIPVPVGWHSFGGWRASLFGDHHMYGPAGLDFYTRAKVVTTRWPEPTGSRLNLDFPTL